MAKVLIIDDDEMFSEMLSDMVRGLGHKVTTVFNLMEGAKEAASGLYEVVFLDVRLPDGNGLDLLPRIRELPSQPEVIIITGAGDTDGAELAMKNGAWDYIEKQSSISKMTLALVRALQHAEEKKGKNHAANGQVVKQGKIIGFIGAKGGVGTTTVALNVASALAKRHHNVIAVELKSSYGTFSLMTNQHPVHHLGSLLDAGLDWSRDLGRHLHHFSGLRLLYGPQQAEEFRELDPAWGKEVLQKLAGLADYVIVDLPPCPFEACQTLLLSCNYLVLVTEREQFSVESGKMLLQLLGSWGVNRSMTGTVITTRMVLPLTMKIEDIKSRFDCEIVGIVPYSTEACAMAQKAGRPIVLCQPHNIAALSLKDIADKLL